MFMLIIYGQIMINGPLFGTTGQNTREYIYGQQHIDKLLGELLVITYLGTNFSSCPLKRLKRLKDMRNPTTSTNTICQINYLQVNGWNTRAKCWSLKTWLVMHLCSTKTPMSKTSAFMVYWSGYMCVKPVQSRYCQFSYRISTTRKQKHDWK